MVLVETISGSPGETELAGEKLAKVLLVGDVILLVGDLGMGKTAFTRGIARGLGISARVQSPTFVIVKNYDGDKPLAHADLYRFDDEQIFGIELLELGSPDVVTVIEWANRAAELFEPFAPLTVSFQNCGAESFRKLLFCSNHKAWGSRLAAVEL